MKKKIFIVALLIAVVAVFFVACNDVKDYSEVIANGSFETVSDGSVGNWTKSNGSSITFKTDNDKQSDQYDPNLGTRYAYIEKSSSSSAYDYMYQTVKLEKNQLYRLSVYAKVSSIQTSSTSGFYVGFKEDLNYSGISVTKTGDGYQTYEVYFRSTAGGDFTLTVGLGNEKATSYGTVSFDNVSLMPVDTVPSDYEGEVGVLRTSADYTLSNGGSVTFVVLGTILTPALAYAAFMLIRKFTKSDNGFDPEGGKPQMSNKGFMLFVGAIVAGFVIRFVILLCCYGMGSEIDDMATAALSYASNGISTAFTNTSLNNYPAGTAYVLWILGKIAQFMGVESGSMGMSMLMRIPTVIADLIICYTVASFAFQEREDEKSAVIFGWIYAIFPLFFTFGAMYGSYETIAILFLALTLISMLDKNYIACGIFYVFSLLFSYYALLALPVVLTFEIVTLIREIDVTSKDGEVSEIKAAKKNILTIVLTMVGGFILYYVVTLPMSLSNIKQGNVFYCFKQIYAFFKTSALLNTDTFNLYGIFGAANSTSRNTLLEICNWLFVTGICVATAVAYYRSKDRSDLVLFAAATFALYSALGAQATVVTMPIAAALLLLYLAMVPDRRVFAIFGCVSALSFLNIAELVSRSGFLGDYTEASYLAFYSKSPVMIIFSIAAVAVALWLVYAVVDICFYGNVQEARPIYGKMSDEIKDTFTLRSLRERFAKKKR